MTDIPLRTPLHRIGEWPVLIPCAAAEADGFLGPTPLRIIKTSDVTPSKTDKWGKLAAGITAADWKLLGSIKLLLNAREAGDLALAKSAAEAFLLPELGVGTLAGDVSADEGRTMFGQSLVGETLTHGSTLAMLVSGRFSGVRMILWQVGKRDELWAPDIHGNRPAPVYMFNAEGDSKLRIAHRLSFGIFCPTFKDAAAVKLIANGIRVCFRCQALFVTTRENQNYCCPQHRNSDRTARFRAKKRAAKKGRKP